MSPAFADSPEPPVSDADGRTFGSADGLAGEESEVSAARARKSITDSLGLNDAVTKFRYSFDYIHPAAC